MKIILVQNEIEEAIRSYMSNTLSVPAQKQLQIEMTATRGASGVTAEINIIDKDTAVAAQKTEVKEEQDPVSEPLNEADANPFNEAVKEEKPKKTKSFFADLQSTN